MNLLHHFLIAMPTLDDSNFSRSVVYICEYHKNGAMGLVINKPVGDLTVWEVLDKLSIDPEPRVSNVHLNSLVMEGGPVATDRGFILHTPQQKFASSLQISNDVMITSSKDVLETLGTASQPPEALVALGYSGWDRGQLEKELLENSWLTVEADSDILFHTPIEQRWQAAARKLGIDIHTIARQAGHA
ncbi:MAG: YqgE/AlgH family protein [Enterobacteriaceae bacterium]|jgi:putative transcriptional regulator|nr:YqgE/AlgH family protein [Enterobacteriaceae bacterium]